MAKPFNTDEPKQKIEEALGIQPEAEDDPEKQTQPKITKSGKVRLNVDHIQITDHLILGVIKHLIKKNEVTPHHFELETHCMTGKPIHASMDALCRVSLQTLKR